jgi:TonB family protein
LTRVLFVLSAIAIIAISASAHSSVSGANGDDLVDAKLLSVPKVKLPKESSATGLGGRVIVRVSIDEKGHVVDGEASGPDWVCQNVSSPDVVALRSAAKAVALQAKFSPAMNGGQAVVSTMLLNFDFPGRRLLIDTAAVGSGTATVKLSESNSSEKSTTGSIDLSSENVKSSNTVRLGSVDPNSTKSRAVTFGNADTATPPRDVPYNPNSTTLSGGVLNGKAVSLPAPPYPPAAKAVRASGAVSIQILILENGTVFAAKPLSGHPLLRSAASDAACEARFTPTLLEGSPVKVSGVITYNFNL